MTSVIASGPYFAHSPPILPQKSSDYAFEDFKTISIKDLQRTFHLLVEEEDIYSISFLIREIPAEALKMIADADLNAALLLTIDRDLSEQAEILIQSMSSEALGMKDEYGFTALSRAISYDRWESAIAIIPKLEPEDLETCARFEIPFLYLTALSQKTSVIARTLLNYMTPEAIRTQYEQCKENSKFQAFLERHPEAHKLLLEKI